MTVSSTAPSLFATNPPGGTTGPYIEDTGGPALLNIAGSPHAAGVYSTTDTSSGYGTSSYCTVASYASFLRTTMGTASNNPPAAPSVLSPGDAATGCPTTMLFSWNPATDPDGDTVFYRLIVSRSSSFTSPITADVQPPAGMAAAAAGLVLCAGFFFSTRKRSRLFIILLLAGLLFSCSGAGLSPQGPVPLAATLTGLQSSATYYWKVVAIDAKGAETETAVRTFTTAP